MLTHTIALFAVTEFLLSLTPGPAVLLVVGLSMRHGFSAGLMATLGILTTNAVFFALSALGVGSLIVASALLFTVIKWIGAGYLVYLGTGMIKPLLERLILRRGATEDLHNLTAAPAPGSRFKEGKWRTFWRGVSLQASNPKNLAFFVAILPQFVISDGHILFQMSVLGTVSVLLELPVLLAYCTISTLSVRLMRERIVEWIEGIGGGILIALGGALAFSRRP